MAWYQRLDGVMVFQTLSDLRSRYELYVVQLGRSAWEKNSVAVETTCEVRAALTDIKESLARDPSQSFFIQSGRHSAKLVTACAISAFVLDQIYFLVRWQSLVASTKFWLTPSSPQRM